MRVLLDTNVLLDVLLNRVPWFAEAAQVWDSHRDGHITAHVASFSLPTIYYIVKRHSGDLLARAAVRMCLETFEIIAVNRSTLELAAHQSGGDFEDNLQIACALQEQLQAIVTRDQNAWPASPLTVVSPTDFLRQIGTKSP